LSKGEEQKAKKTGEKYKKIQKFTASGQRNSAGTIFTELKIFSICQPFYCLPLNNKPWPNSAHKFCGLFLIMSTPLSMGLLLSVKAHRFDTKSRKPLLI
jgi:hypothetical protein